MSVRVRYAPSPTGSPHVGNIRTALFNHLFARRHGGVNILRIEDTDRTRYVPGCEEEIIESLAYVGVEYQEGPFRQSERKDAGVYQPVIDQMIESGAAYWAFDTPEELTELREYQQVNKMATGYFGGDWRDATPAQVEAARDAGKPGVIRLRIPRNEMIVVEDAIRGRVEFDSNIVDDPVIIKGDGMPTYHFAAMVDDHFMEITHVFRGEEWISSAPKHVTLFKALGWTPPEFVHVPVINGKDGKKLSKRHGDTACLDFRRSGYMGHVLANFTALIGWAPGQDREIMSMDEMCEAFDIRGLQPSPGIFDLDKLNWMSGNGIRALSMYDVVEQTRDYSSCAENQQFWIGREMPERAAAMKLLAAQEYDLCALAILQEQERVVTLAEFGEACEFFFVSEVKFDPKAVEKWGKQPHTTEMFEFFVQELQKAEGRPDPDFYEAMARQFAEKKEFEKLGPVVHPTRVALTGKTAGPSLWQLMAVLGPERMIARFRRGMTVLA
jgi:glutamyl-tRNA synthetase